MEKQLKSKKHNRAKRALRVRARVRGDGIRPRLSVVKSNKHVHVQLINDETGSTLSAISTLSKGMRQTEFNKKNKTSAKQLGLKIADYCKTQEIKKVIFDRGPFKYHGVVAAVADGAREGGLDF